MNNVVCQCCNQIKPKIVTIKDDNFFESVTVVNAHDTIATTVKLHKLSYDQLPGGALIVADRDIITSIRRAGGNKPRMLDAMSFCRDKMHFELLGRPPVIIFNTQTPLTDIRIALYSKTGFSKSTEFTAYYVRYKESTMRNLVNRFKNIFKNTI
ncbi:hypothetical protein 44RRORF112c [Aeromonas phage 44RR2.8t]|uniref:Uncharacterized protein n=2 Tax=Biquartavirus 44RR2 TaxID=115987 RepID=Q6U9J0_9CAUD|nr:hypothetical protein ST44RRORF112c [Aeromonas phage 44RR2.8t]AAQ81431.1 hypothetical protein 44RRORF112c [Aeromonas phage 44RR2.8t]